MPPPNVTPAREEVLAFSLASPPADFAEHPARWWAALREHDPVHELPGGAFYLTRHADVLAVYRSSVVSSDKKAEFGPRFGVGTPLYEHHTTSQVFSDPPLHTRLRRIVMGALSQKAIARMEAGVRSMVARLLDDIEAARAPDLIEHFAGRIPVEVIGNLLDIPRGERGPLRGWSLATLSALEPAPSPAMLEAGNRAVTEFLDYLRLLVAERRRHPGDPEMDVLTRLMQGDATGSLDERELLHNCIFLLNAGHETTTNLIGNGAWLLMRHPSQCERLLAEPALIDTAVEELLRLESPIQLNNRKLLAPIELSTRTLPEGAYVNLAIGGANRDPAVFENPEAIDIARKPNHHLAFGQGAHACSGMNVARMEARIALLALFQRFPRLALTGGEERDRRLRFRGFKKLPVMWH
jgi:cytochrome P450